MRKILIIAGDKSGDLFAGILAQKLKEIYQEKISIFSLGGENLKKHTSFLFNLVNYAVSGLWETSKYLIRLYSVLKKTILWIKKIKPDLIILVDFPEFNLHLAKKLKKQFRIFYYISPQIWAWREKRVKIIKEYIEKMIVIFEFEKEWYLKRGIEAFYFGHPLLDIIPQNFVHNPQNIITFLPGSRKNELKSHLPLILSTYQILKKRLKNYDFLILHPPNIEKSFYLKYVGQNIKVEPYNYQSLAITRFILASSGTATLETAVLGIPFLIFYKVNPLTFLFLKKMVKVKFIGMPNILANRKIAEEFIQKEANPYNLAEKTLEIIENPSFYQKIKKDLSKIKELLKPEKSIENTALFIGKELGL